MIKIQRKSYIKEPYGNIDYHYSICEEYPNGILIFMGSYINKKYRGKGKYKMILKEFLNSFPEGTLVQVPISNKKIISLFEKIGFEKTNNIEYWGTTNNSINYKWIINKTL